MYDPIHRGSFVAKVEKVVNFPYFCNARALNGCLPGFITLKRHLQREGPYPEVIDPDPPSFLYQNEAVMMVPGTGF